MHSRSAIFHLCESVDYIFNLSFRNITTTLDYSTNNEKEIIPILY